jgi:hypothetical protein
MRLIDAEYVLWKVQSEAFPQSVDFGQGRESVLDEIRKAPTVDAEPVKRGHWIHHRDWGVDGECPVECSECGMGEDYEMNYCSRCGAKMERRR